MSKPDAKRRYRQRRKQRSACYAFDASNTIAIRRDSVCDDSIGLFAATIRFTPIVIGQLGQLGEPLYPCTWCGRLVVLMRGALCDDCTPF